jgi:formate transporter
MTAAGDRAITGISSPSSGRSDLNASHFTAIDALLPREMAKAAEQIGVDKTRLDAPRLLTLAVLAGAFIAFGSMFSVVVTAGADGALPYGLIRLLGGLAFSLGLILVVVGGAELFTGNNLMVMAYASGRVGMGEVLRAWGLVYIGNFVGGVGIAVLVFLAAGYSHGGGAVGTAALVSAETKTSLSALQAFVHGLLANVLVCLAIWLSYSARTTTDKILAIVPPVAAFVAAGFEHSIANMYLLSFALMTKFGAPGGFWDAISQTPSAFPHLTVVAALANLLWVTMGNMAGGILVGVTYWFVYLRKPPAEIQIEE